MNQNPQGPWEKQCVHSLDIASVFFPDLYPSPNPPKSSNHPFLSISTATLLSVTMVFGLQQPDSYLCFLILFIFHTQTKQLECRLDPLTSLPRASQGIWNKKKVFNIVQNQAQSRISTSLFSCQQSLNFPALGQTPCISGSWHTASYARKPQQHLVPCPYPSHILGQVVDCCPLFSVHVKYYLFISWGIFLSLPNFRQIQCSIPLIEFCITLHSTNKFTSK